MNSRSVLGKGLSSLIPGATPGGSEAALKAEAFIMAGQVAENRDRHPGISVISIDDIQVNPYQPRREFDPRSLDELAQSIRVNGIIQPLVVRKTNQGYILIAGERRLRASRLAGLRQVPIVIRKSTDREALELALIENIQRENLNCVDEAL
ncbi:MAG: ParB/RepB/Spo0J family partition protein, partial [Bdellovibrionota bacterium]